MVEMTGIEPVSENASVKISPSAVITLFFPPLTFNDKVRMAVAS